MDGRAIAQAASRRFLTAEARVRAQVNPYGIYGGRIGNGIGVSPSFSVLPFHRSIFTYVSSGGWTIGPLAAAVPCRRSVTSSKTITVSDNNYRAAHVGLPISASEVGYAHHVPVCSLQVHPRNNGEINKIRYNLVEITRGYWF
jgi:hypothetical protein